MAEIKIEKKKPIWPWIILALVILALLYFFVFSNDDTESQEENNTEQREENAWEEDNDTTSLDIHTSGWENQSSPSAISKFENEYLA